MRPTREGARSRRRAMAGRKIVVVGRREQNEIDERAQRVPPGRSSNRLLKSPAANITARSCLQLHYRFPARAPAPVAGPTSSPNAIGGKRCCTGRRLHGDVDRSPGRTCAPAPNAAVAAEALTKDATDDAQGVTDAALLAMGMPIFTRHRGVGDQALDIVLQVAHEPGHR